MVNLVPAKCPNCGAQLELDDNMKRAECSFCKSTIIVDDAIAKYKIEISGKVEVDGIKTFNQKIEDARKYFKIEKYASAKKKLDEVLKEDPFNLEAIYEWLKSYIMVYRNHPNKVNESFLREDDEVIWTCIALIVEKYNQLKKIDVEKKYEIELKDYIEDLEYLKEQYNKLLEDEEKCKEYSEYITKHSFFPFEAYFAILIDSFELTGRTYDRLESVMFASGFSFSKVKVRRDGSLMFISTHQYEKPYVEVLYPSEYLTIDEVNKRFNKAKELLEKYNGKNGNKYLREKKIGKLFGVFGKKDK